MQTEAVQRMEAEPWFLDIFREQGAGEVRIAGWCLQDPLMSPSESMDRFRVNGQRPLSTTYPISRPDVQAALQTRQQAEMSGFELVAPLRYVDGVCTISVKDSLHSGLSQARGNWYVPDASLHGDVPPASQRYRVIANEDLNGFLLIGATDAFRLAAAHEAYVGKSLFETERILDWGVGCGRVARHLIPRHQGELLGCDIDADNVAWCAEHLSGRFQACRLEPPLPIESNSIDVVYGVSVFTHLTRHWEAAWLRELHRVLKPGGVLMATVHGETTINFSPMDLHARHALRVQLQREGIVVNGLNDQLNGFVEHPQEYVNTFHAPAYIQQTWGSVFDRVVRLPGYVFTHDLVLATKAR